MPDAINRFELFRSPNGVDDWTQLPGTGIAIAADVREFEDLTHPDPRLFYELKAITDNGVEIPYNIVKIQTSGRVLWASDLSTAANDVAKAIAVDTLGNVIIAGDQSGQFFVTKYFPSGTPIWTNLFGTGYGKGVAVDANGNIYAAAGTSPNFYPYADFFVVKLTPDGTQPNGQLWPKSNGFALNGAADAISIAVDGNGDVLVTGGFWGTLDFGDGNPVTGPPIASAPALFLVKYHPDGTLVWLKTIAGESLLGTGVGTDSNNNIYVTGNLNGSANFGGDDLNGSNTGVPFLVKYSTDGDHIWSTAFTNTSSGASATGISVAPNGDIALTGLYVNSFDIGGGLYTTSFPPRGSFLAKFDGDSVYQWSKNLDGASGFAVGWGVAIDAPGNVALTGMMAGSFNFGNGQLLVSHGSTDIFVTKYSPTGQCLWSRNFGSTQQDQGNAVAFDANGDVAVTGVYFDYIDFGTGPFPFTAQNDAFVLKLTG